ncbi:MAG: hypothetical protein ACRCYE_05890 [Sarcina sp.]
MNFKNNKSNNNRSNTLCVIDTIKNKTLLIFDFSWNFRETDLQKLAKGVSVKKSISVNNIKYSKTLVSDKISIFNSEKEASPIKIFIIKNIIVSPKKIDITLIALFEL